VDIARLRAESAVHAPLLAAASRRFWGRWLGSAF
jgi:hypothetical protein